MLQRVEYTTKPNQLRHMAFSRSVRHAIPMSDISVQYKPKGIDHDKEKSPQPRTDQAH